MITLTLFLFGFQVSSTDKLQIVRFVTVAKQAECKLLLGHLYSKLHIQLGNFEPRISTVGAKRSLSVEVDRKEMVLRTVSSYKLELIKRQVSYCSVCCYASLFSKPRTIVFQSPSTLFLPSFGPSQAVEGCYRI